MSSGNKDLGIESQSLWQNSDSLSFEKYFRKILNFCLKTTFNLIQVNQRGQDGHTALIRACYERSDIGTFNYLRLTLLVWCA